MRLLDSKVSDIYDPDIRALLDDLRDLGRHDPGDTQTLQHWLTLFFTDPHPPRKFRCIEKAEVTLVNEVLTDKIEKMNRPGIVAVFEELERIRVGNVVGHADYIHSGTVYVHLNRLMGRICKSLAKANALKKRRY